MDDLKLADFPLKTFDKVRYVDTDRQGHVNNALFASFLETGRVEVLYNSEYPILSDGSSFVIVSLHFKLPGRNHMARSSGYWNRDIENRKIAR